MSKSSTPENVELITTSSFISIMIGIFIVGLFLGVMFSGVFNKTNPRIGLDTLDKVCAQTYGNQFEFDYSRDGDIFCHKVIGENMIRGGG